MADENTEIMARNQRGELWVRGQNVMKGYWRNPKATKETKTDDGWLRTGDIAYVDDRGKFHVVDRMKVGTLSGVIRLAVLTNSAGIDQSQGEPSGSCRTRSAAVGASCHCGCCGDRCDYVRITIIHMLELYLFFRGSWGMEITDLFIVTMTNVLGHM